VTVDRIDQRVRYRPLDPVTLNGLLASLAAPTVTPAGPFVVPVEERRRFLAQLPPSILKGRDDAVPPEPEVVEPDDKRRRYRLAEPLSINGALAYPFGLPPAPVFALGQDGRLRLTPTPVILTGLLAFSQPVTIVTGQYDPPNPGPPTGGALSATVYDETGPQAGGFLVGVGSGEYDPPNPGQH